MKEILSQIERQLQNFFIEIDMTYIEKCAAEAYQKCLHALGAFHNKYLNVDGIPHFSLNHSGCWAIYLYYLSNSMSKIEEAQASAQQIYYLNKVMHGVDWYCEVDLPQHFMCEHPIGSVLGRATYGDYLFIYQGVTIGASTNMKTGKMSYPVLGNNLLMYSDSKILGNSQIGNNVVLSANACVLNQNIPDDSIVFGISPNLVIKHAPEVIETHLKRIWR